MKQRTSNKVQSSDQVEDILRSRAYRRERLYLSIDPVGTFDDEDGLSDAQRAALAVVNSKYH